MQPEHKGTISKEWCERMARLEGDAEIGAGLLARLPLYTPDPAEEAWCASPEGKRATARALREQAGRLIARAATLDQEARDAEAANV